MRLPPFGSRQQLRIGLLGGSFNPAHAAHREISLIALGKLKLDAVWWLVSPQNPLKSPRGMAPLDQRLRQAQVVADHPRIMVSAPEMRLGTRFTAATLRRLRLHYPAMRFVWLMGADNLVQMRHWKNWRQIAACMPIAVLDRPGYGRRAAASLVAQALKADRVKLENAVTLASKPPPALLLLPSRLNPLSATEIRSARKPGS